MKKSKKIALMLALAMLASVLPLNLAIGSGEGGAVSTVSANTASTVVSPAAIFITGTGVSGSHFSLAPNTTRALTVSFYPANVTDRRVTWWSSNPGIATVSAGGVVTARATGSTVINVASMAHPGIAHSITLTVTTSGWQGNRWWDGFQWRYDNWQGGRWWDGFQWRYDSSWQGNRWWDGFQWRYGTQWQQTHRWWDGHRWVYSNDWWWNQTTPARTVHGGGGGGGGTASTVAAPGNATAPGNVAAPGDAAAPGGAGGVGGALPVVPGAGATLRFTIGSIFLRGEGLMVTLEAAPFIDRQTNRTMVPLRAIAEGLGAGIDWDEATRTAHINRDNVTMSLPVDQPLPGGMGVPMIVDGRTFVPLRYVSEILGEGVRWDAVNRAVYVN
ncbi:MAG: stalk domain-containing protein [Defluviitaleaceae bacterium]|nr:stalk domain-containing protein [Defluviitaleaceae bacterium]